MSPSNIYTQTMSEDDITVQTTVGGVSGLARRKQQSNQEGGNHRRNRSGGSFPVRSTAALLRRDLQKENVFDNDEIIDLTTPARDEHIANDKVPTHLPPGFQCSLFSSPIPNNGDSIEIINPESLQISSPSHPSNNNDTITIHSPTPGGNTPSHPVSLFDDDDSINDANNAINISDDTTEEETAEQRLAREQEESLALARHLMAEEAVASYAMSADFLQENAEHYSEDDLAALRAVMAEEDPYAEAPAVGDGRDTSQSVELSYDTLLRLGETMGDVKQERWAMIARSVIETLETRVYDCKEVGDNVDDDSLVKCLICQCGYENGERLRVLPCQHCFHMECVDQWLESRDVCPYCRQSIVENNN
eukprot:CAMPEP_0172508150 /NCGR_PEP_ID=MMETSP1066-20121228/209696_1 /TAXON_ID=671091 /ORGANISM="Coscinodiscus wailesii, Strain CCMP2513" /LENGTH=362 /DNA_ID=CAMNT_0013286001 /DNA_START=191 /DNA_END=1279 /DNA_ORIENTATION=-